MTNSTRSVDLDTIERLAEKVQALVGLLERTRAELAQTSEDNGRLTTELTTLRERLSAAQNEGAEVKTLLAERGQIQARVSEMLTQLEAIDL